MISVLMGVHKVYRFVYPAIDSMLAQEDVELELVIVANGPEADTVAETIREHYGNDARIRIFESPVGQLAHALNIAVSHARYDYIARMDADCISQPDRLKRQLAFLRETGKDLIGCGARYIDEHDNVIGQEVRPRGAAIARKLPFKNTLIHPTILTRRQVILDARGYSGGFSSEDRDLWLRLRCKAISWDNMPELLLDYRIHSDSAQGQLLARAEVAGYMMREFVLSKNPVWLVAVAVPFAKALIRGR